jgi:membrane fusion protein, multidrug efflux system
MKITIRLFVLSLIVGLLTFVKIKYFPAPSSVVAPPSALGSGINGKGNPVSGVVVRGVNVDSKIFAVGTLLPNEAVDLKPEASGRITQLNIQEGKPVTKGQLLVKLNDADLQATIKKLNAQLNLASESENRLRRLLDVKGISQDEYDIVANQISGLRADLEFTQAQIAKTEIYAPFNGICGLRNISVGGYANSQTAIATIQQLNPIKVEFSVPEKYANQVRIGDEINFFVDNGKEINANSIGIKAKVYAAETQIDPITRTLKVRATAQNNSNELHPGAFVKVDFRLKELNGAFMIPSEAVVPVLKGQQIFVCKDGKAKVVKVDIGLRTDAKVQIISGLAEGDTVVTLGIIGLKPETKLNVTLKNYTQ